MNSNEQQYTRRAFGPSAHISQMSRAGFFFLSLFFFSFLFFFLSSPATIKKIGSHDG